MDEAKLIRGLRRRRRGALDQAIEQFTPYVGAVVWRVLAPSSAGREDVEEAVSDVFLALWAHAEELDPARGLRPWLGTVARNRARDVLRRLPPTCPLEEGRAALEEGPQEALERREQARQLWQAVDSLEEPDRTLLFRYYYQEEKLKDIAEDLKLNLSTAKTRLARGRKRLRGILTKGGGVGEEAF